MSRRRVASCAGASALLLAACTREPFAIVGCDLGPEGGAKLNQPLVLSFNDDVDPGSVRPGMVRVVRTRDDAEVAGSLSSDGARVTFHPRLPLLADLSDVAFQPGESYRIEVPGLPVMRSLRGLSRGPLVHGLSATFRAMSIASDRLADAPASDLFIDPLPGAPEWLDDPAHAARLDPQDRTRVWFSEPLDPRTAAAARFRLHGPWSKSALPVENPLMKGRMIDDRPSREAGSPRGLAAILELSLVEPPPKPISAHESYEIEMENDVLRDFGGLAVRRGDIAQKSVPLLVDR